jgi:hypothetical protein
MTKYPCRIGGEIEWLTIHKIAKQIDRSAKFVYKHMAEAKELDIIGADLFDYIQNMSNEAIVYAPRRLEDAVSRENNKRLKFQEAAHQLNKWAFDKALYGAW